MEGTLVNASTAANRYKDSCAKMLAAVVAALPDTTSLPGMTIPLLPNHPTRARVAAMVEAVDATLTL
jgi:hypothetical protein